MFLLVCLFCILKLQASVMRNRELLSLKDSSPRSFSGSPVDKTSPSNAGHTVQSVVGELRSHILCGKRPEHKTETIL